MKVSFCVMAFIYIDYFGNPNVHICVCFPDQKNHNRSEAVVDLPLEPTTDVYEDGELA